MMSRYGVPHVLVIDNDPQFTGKDIKWFLDEIHMERRFVSVKHAQVEQKIR